MPGQRDPSRPLTKALLAPVLDLRPGSLASVPLLGPRLEDRRWMRAARPVAREIDALLASRAPVPIDAWGQDPAVQRAATAILTAISEEMTWANDRFRPKDDGAVAFWSWYDGLDFTSAVLAIEEELGFYLTEEDEEIAHEITLGAFAERLAERIRDPGSAEGAPSEREGGSRPGYGRRSGVRRLPRP